MGRQGDVTGPPLLLDGGDGLLLTPGLVAAAARHWTGNHEVAISNSFEFNNFQL